MRRNMLLYGFLVLAACSPHRQEDNAVITVRGVTGLSVELQGEAKKVFQEFLSEKNIDSLWFLVEFVPAMSPPPPPPDLIEQEKLEEVSVGDTAAHYQIWVCPVIAQRDEYLKRLQKSKNSQDSASAFLYVDWTFQLKLSPDQKMLNIEKAELVKFVD